MGGGGGGGGGLVRSLWWVCWAAWPSSLSVSPKREEGRREEAAACHGMGESSFVIHILVMYIYILLLRCLLM